jgi:hypothetical protein
MTLLETERLIRKITELLKQTGNPEMAPKLAGDYAAACHSANLRVQQCEAMIKAGDRPQAIQLAETAPVLLDLVTLLEFHGSDEWRAYCQQNSLPAPDRIDPRSVKVLNDCYAQGITSDHPLYAVYRRSVLQRNDEEALKTLQSITRLNPADTNAASELARLDAKVLAARITHLGMTLSNADPTLLVAEIEAIEAFGFKNKPEGDIWRKAQAVRCQWLLTEATQLQSTSRWLEVLAKLDFIRRLEDEFKVSLPADALKQRSALETWARGEQAKDKTEREFQSLLSQLRQQVQQSEEKDTSARYIELPEMRDDYEALHKIWRGLTDFTRAIPEDATADFRKRSALLETEIARRTAIRRRFIVGASLVVLLMIGGVAWVVAGHLKARDFSRQLQAAITERQVHAADKLLNRAHNEKIGDASTVAAAETFSTKEHALLANFESAFNQLPPQVTGTPEAARLAAIADQLATARDALAALAPDLKAENEPRLQAFEKQWQDYLTDSGTAVNSLLDQWVSAAEKESDDLDYRAPLEKTTRQLAALADLVQKMQDCEAGFGKNLQLRSDLLERSAAVRAKFNAYNLELTKLNSGLDALRKARTAGEFSSGIQLITSSEFDTAPAAVAALAIQTLDTSEETVLRVLLRATNAGTWVFIQKPGPASFVPASVMPAGRQILKGLADDPAVNANHQHYRLWLDADGNNKVDWITVDVLDDSLGWKVIKAWSPSANARSAYFENHDYGWFGGQFKLSPTQTVYRLESLGPLDEATAFHSVGLEKVLAGDAYAQPMLAVLEAVKNSREGSPVFRAWLFLRLVDLMNLQPDAWGLAFCPAARLHQAKIEAIVGSPLNSGDWFVPGKVKAYSDKLEHFFDSVKAISYTKQAEGLLALDRAAARAGLHYAGFVGLDGRPDYLDMPVGGEIWGYAAKDKQPVLLAAKMDDGQALKQPALPLSPLFGLDRPAKEYLTEAGVNPEDVSFQGVLPPLFAEPARP